MTTMNRRRRARARQLPPVGAMLSAGAKGNSCAATIVEAKDVPEDGPSAPCVPAFRHRRPHVLL